MMATIDLKLKKLDKLDVIEAHLTTIDSDIWDLKQSLPFLHDTTTEIQVKQKQHDTAMKNIKEKIKAIEEDKKKLEQEVVDVRVHSMRNNLIFYNIPEVKDEDPFNVVKSFVESKLKIEARNIELERAHRLGNPRITSQKSTSWSLIAKFLRHQDR